MNSSKIVRMKCRHVAYVCNVSVTKIYDIQ